MNKKEIGIIILAILVIFCLMHYLGQNIVTHKITVGENKTSSFTLPTNYKVASFQDRGVMIYNENNGINVSNVSDINSINETVNNYRLKYTNDTINQEDILVDDINVVKVTREINTTTNGSENTNTTPTIITKYWFEKNNITYCITITNETQNTEDGVKQIIKSMVNSDFNEMINALKRGDINGLKNSMFN